MSRILTALTLAVALFASTAASAEETGRSERVVRLLYVVLGPAVAAVAAGSATAGGLDNRADRATMDTAIQTAAGHLKLTHAFLRQSPLTLNHSVALVVSAGIGLDGFVPVE